MYNYPDSNKEWVPLPLADRIRGGIAALLAFTCMTLGSSPLMQSQGQACSMAVATIFYLGTSMLILFKNVERIG